MARLHVTQVGDGQHPSEVLVTISTKNGIETLILDRRSLKDDMIEVGYPIGSEGDYFLIELPRETMRGEWRVLIPRTDIKEDVAA